MDIEKTMILVKGEDKTESIAAIAFEAFTRKILVTYNGGYSYPYNEGSVVVLENPKSLELNGRIAYVNGIPVYEPVSYTHLDVYKRQLLGWSRARR